MEALIVNGIFIGFFVIAAAGVIWVILATVRRTRAGGKSIAVGLVVALVTAVIVFVLTYCSAWAELRQDVARGDYGYGVWWDRMEYEFSMIHEALSDFARKHGHYPNSLSEVPGLKDCNFVDPWGNSFYYEKTPQGFRLLSLGRDGKPGGVGLDADIDSDRENRIPYEPTLSQFLFEARGSHTLFVVATLASLCAGLVGYISSRPQDDRLIAAGPLLLSVVFATVSAIGVTLFLVWIYAVGNHH